MNKNQKIQKSPLDGIEPSTLRLTAARSNQLSYGGARNRILFITSIIQNYLQVTNRLSSQIKLVNMQSKQVVYTLKHNYQIQKNVICLAKYDKKVIHDTLQKFSDELKIFAPSPKELSTGFEDLQIEFRHFDESDE
ncbi:Hypothetical_protein [Hexamita inflata]|uniref:Hypothetical_protein n=1 Tax=Hexamita inflata TaxID=28002 RepID=A0ABP1JAF6_9EUKA